MHMVPSQNEREENWKRTTEVNKLCKHHKIILFENNKKKKKLKH